MGYGSCQAIGDLAAYAGHAGRGTVTEDDVTLLLERQRMTMGSAGHSLADLARQYLPMEALEQLLPVALAGNEVMPARKAARRKRGSGTGKAAAK